MASLTEGADDSLALDNQKSIIDSNSKTSLGSLAVCIPLNAAIHVVCNHFCELKVDIWKMLIELKNSRKMTLQL